MSSLEEADAPPDPIIVTINAGGTIFQTYQETLTRGSPYFQAYFHGGFSKPDPRKEIFLDMDPECFRCLLMRMRMPGYMPPEFTRETAAFLGMELPPTPEEKKRLEYEAQRSALAPAKRDLYELAVRLQPGDKVEQEHNNWSRATFKAYSADHEFHWGFIESGTANYKYLWWKDQPQIRVTDPAERAKILAREDPDLTRVVFEK